MFIRFDSFWSEQSGKKCAIRWNEKTKINTKYLKSFSFFLFHIHTSRLNSFERIPNSASKQSVPNDRKKNFFFSFFKKKNIHFFSFWLPLTINHIRLFEKKLRNIFYLLIRQEQRDRSVYLHIYYK